MLIYGKKITNGQNLGTRESFADISATICDIFNINPNLAGDSFFKEVYRGD
jgi:phosphopentomutase